MRIIYILLISLCLSHMAEAQYNVYSINNGVFGYRMKFEGYWNRNAPYYKYDFPKHIPFKGGGVRTEEQYIHTKNKQELIIKYYKHDETKMGYYQSVEVRNDFLLKEINEKYYERNLHFEGIQDSVVIDDLLFYRYVIVGKDSLDRIRLNVLHLERMFDTKVLLIEYVVPNAKSEFDAEKALEKTNLTWKPLEQKESNALVDILNPKLKAIKEKKSSVKSDSLAQIAHQIFTSNFKKLPIGKQYSYEKLQKLTSSKWERIPYTHIYMADIMKDANLKTYDYYPLGKVEVEGKTMYYMIQVNRKQNEQFNIVSYEEITNQISRAYYFFCKEYYWPEEGMNIRPNEQLQITKTHFVRKTKNNELRNYQMKIEPMGQVRMQYLLGKLAYKASK